MSKKSKKEEIKELLEEIKEEKNDSANCKDQVIEAETAEAIEVEEKTTVECNNEVEETTEVVEDRKEEHVNNVVDSKKVSVVVEERHGFVHEANGVLTKAEGFLMFVILLLMILIVSVGLNKNINKTGGDYMDTIKDLKQQIVCLETKIESLENEIAEQKELADIHISVNGEKVDVSYGEDDESIDNSMEEEFDTRPFLGVGFVEDEVSNPNTLGLKVGIVYESSPAQFAGMLVGDIITSLNGNKMTNFDDLAAVIDSMKAGDAITIEVLRIVDGEIQAKTLETTLTYRGNFELD